MISTPSASNGSTEVDLSGTSVVQYSGMDDIGTSFIYRTTGGSFTTITHDISYVHHEYDRANVTTNFEDLDFLLVGGRMKF